MSIPIHRISCILIIFCFVLPYPSDANQENNTIYINKLVLSHSERPQDGGRILRLNNLINIALENNKTLEVVRQKLAQSHGQLTQARSGYLPHLSIEGNYNYTHRKDSASSINYINAGSEEEQRTTNFDEYEEDDVVRGAANVSQLIYDFGKTTGAINVGQLKIKAADAHLQRQVQDIIFQVKEAYYTLLEKKRLIDVAKEYVKSLTQHRDQAKIYHHAGMRTRIDVVNAEVELSQANMDLLRAKYSFKTAKVALEQVLGVRPYNGIYAVCGEEVNLDNILEAMPPVPDSLDNLIKGAMQRRPDILRLKFQVEAARVYVDQIKGDYWPTITAEAKYEDYDTDLSLYKDSWEAGVACTWELFSGLHTQGTVAEARGRLFENKARLQDMQLAVIKEVTDSYLQADENREGVQIALQTLELAKENILLAEKRYQSGAYDVLEYNDAQLSLTQARSELVVTYYGYLDALAGIEHAMSKYQKYDEIK